jgi:hypothetical protein
VTAGNLIDLTRTLSGMPDVPPGHLLTLLNTVNDEVSRDIGVPIGTVDFVDVTSVSMLQIPQNGREEGLLAVYQLMRDDDGNVQQSRQMPLWTFQQASEYSPNWTIREPAESAQFIVYDPSQLYNNPMPVPNPSVDFPHSYRMVYLVHPCEMETLEDPPLDGKWPGFHDLLAFRAAYLLTRDEKMLREYELKVRRARGRATRTALPSINQLWMTTGAWRGGR